MATLGSHFRKKADFLMQMTNPDNYLDILYFAVETAEINIGIEHHLFGTCLFQVDCRGQVHLGHKPKSEVIYAPRSGTIYQGLIKRIEFRLS